jgi:serine phosphatase RsbU (regulator of sigma subunit)/Tfp pilus assembly protein PilF
MRIRNSLMIFLSLFFCAIVTAQKQDSIELVKKLKTETNDSARIYLLNELAYMTRFEKDIGLGYANRILAMDSSAYGYGYGSAYIHLATIYRSKGKYKPAEQFARKAIGFAQRRNLKVIEAKGWGTLGNILVETGDVKNSSDCLEKAVSLFQQTHDTSGVMIASTNLGGFYYREDMYDKAVTYFRMALDYARKKNDPYILAQSYNNIGNVCLYVDELDSAYSCFQRAYKIARDNEFGELANAIVGNLGDVSKLQDKPGVALKYFEQQYEEAKRNEYYMGITQSLRGMGEVYGRQKKFDLALAKVKELMGFAAGASNVTSQLDAYSLGTEIYAAKGMYKEALMNHKRYATLKDSLGNEEIKKKVFELHEQYQSERKDNEILMKTADLEKEQATTKQRSAERNVLLIIVVFALVMIFFVARGYFQKKKYNEQITVQKNAAEKQKGLVEEKNKEILDSIYYAKHIQEAILPSREMSKDVVKDAFILYKPKDIVAGDFYWYSVKNNKRIITAADCTGHGVPGALMSMLGITFLNEIVNHMSVTKPAEILSELRDLVKTTLKQRGSEGESKDGMDMALISLDPDTLKLEFCGANNPLWIFRTENGSQEFIEIEPDKRPVGYFRGMGIPFTNKEFQLKKGDHLFLFTDGYADQFGGPKARPDEGPFGRGKKFKYKQLRELLSSILEKPMSEQHDILSETFDNWKGALEQVDDVCIIGIRI